MNNWGGMDALADGSVLSVDDHEDFREGIAYLLRGLGYSVVAVPRATEALALLRRGDAKPAV